MKSEDKELLVRDLSARLPYGVICQYNCVIPCGRITLEKTNERDVLKGIIPMSDGHIGFMVGVDKVNALEGDIKPYLRPMSSMTEEEYVYFMSIRGMNLRSYEIHEMMSENFSHPNRIAIVNTLGRYSHNIDWLNENMFDYRGLIEKGLALEAPEEMYEK